MEDPTYEVGERLHYTGPILISSTQPDLPMDAVERDVVVTGVDDDGTVYIRYGDGLEDYMSAAHMSYDYERVTWDTTT